MCADNENPRIPKRTYRARLVQGENNAEGLETYKVILVNRGDTAAELSITLKPILTGMPQVAVIMDGAKFNDQNPLFYSALCLMGMEAFLNHHSLSGQATQMHYGEELLLEVCGSISMLCEKSESVPGAYYAMEREHRMLLDRLTESGFEVVAA